MKKAVIICLFMVFSMGLHAQIFSVKEGTISFFSKTPLENIDAHNKSVNSYLNTTNNEILFIVPVRGFEFKKKLMQEHFNENYMESDKYPSANFTGKIEGITDYTKSGEYEVKATGKLKMHGVEKDISEKGKITISEGMIKLEAAFVVALKDFNIERPKIVYQNIADNIDINLNINYTPYKKAK